jgi:hypothetical protein
MKTFVYVSIRKMFLRLIREIAIDASIGAVCGGLFGLIFGGFGAVLHGESWRLVSIAGYFALCGAGAGTLLGACSTILNEGAKSPSSTPGSCGADVKKANSPAGVPRLTFPGQRRSQTSLPVVSTADRRRTLAGVSNQPLSC